VTKRRLSSTGDRPVDRRSIPPVHRGSSIEADPAGGPWPDLRGLALVSWVQSDPYHQFW
jgi:hypothetical protein